MINYFIFVLKQLKNVKSNVLKIMRIGIIHHDMILKLVSVTSGRGVIANHVIIYFMYYFSVSF